MLFVIFHQVLFIFPESCSTPLSMCHQPYCIYFAHIVKFWGRMHMQSLMRLRPRQKTSRQVLLSHWADKCPAQGSGNRWQWKLRQPVPGL